MNVFTTPGFPLLNSLRGSKPSSTAGRTDGRMRSHSGEQPARTEGATMGRAHRLVSAVSEERLAGKAPRRRVPATSLMLLRCERFRRSTRQFGGSGAAYTLSMRSRHDRLPNTSGSVPVTGTFGAMSKQSPPTGQSTPHVHSQFAKSTPSSPARGQCDGRGHKALDHPGFTPLPTQTAYKQTAYQQTAYQYSMLKRYDPAGFSRGGRENEGGFQKHRSVRIGLSSTQPSA